MKRTNLWKAMFTMILVAAFAVPLALAQQPMGQGKGKWMMYDPATEVTVQGTVEEVKQVPDRRGGPGGTHLIVKTDSETLNVRLGPSTFLTNQNFTFAQGDHIEVTGSKMKFHGADALIAREVKKGDAVLTLRNAQGIPVWSRGQRP